MESMITIDDKFTAWIPFDSIIEKAGKDGKKEMIIGGIASNSTIGEDSQGEIVEVDGMDVSDFLDKGFLNWNHRVNDDPSAIIGEPLSAEKKDGKLYITGKLYPESKKAVGIYELAQALQKSSSSRRLGYSIEGKAVERDKMKKGRIIKSKIFHCAITPSPVNQGTEMQIIKGGLSEMKFESDTINEYLIDSTDQNGIRRTVDKNFNIKVWSEDDLQKAMIAGDITGRETTDQNLTQQPLKVESIDGVKKKKKKKLTKGETLIEISSIFKTEDVQLIKSLYELIEQIDMEVTSETIQKAKELLGLAKAEAVTISTADLSKDKLTEEQITKGRNDYKEAIAKADQIKDQFSKANVELEVKAAATIITPVSVKTEDTELIKGFQSKIDALTALYTDKEKENETLKTQFAELTGKVDQLVKATPGPKSLITKAVLDRFGLDAPTENGEKSISISKERRRLAKELTDISGINKGENFDQMFAQAASYMEIAGALGATQAEAEQVALRLRKEHKIVITA